ncbi:MAG TPA: DUF1614 domain-containing protein [Chloroflexota bacterium]|nr:DUF1614 domain-containing protein [Chloroflexota bacterium]
MGVLLILVTPLVLALLYLNLATFSFERLGLSSEAALLVLFASLVGGMINIPLSRERVVVQQLPRGLMRFFYYYPPAVRERVIAINVGGAIIPRALSAFLAPLAQTLVTVVIVAAVCKVLARITPGVGVTLPAFVPPLVSAAVAMLLASGSAAPVAYIGGTLGTLIGADLLNLPAVRRMPALMLSIGGAGVFDGVFLVGIIAVLVA